MDLLPEGEVLPVVENRPRRAWTARSGYHPHLPGSAAAQGKPNCSILSHMANPDSTPRSLWEGQNPLGCLVLGVTKPALVLKSQLSS